MRAPTEARALRRAQARDVLAIDHHRAVGSAELAGHQVEIGRLASPFGPTMAVSSPGRNAQKT